MKRLLGALLAVTMVLACIPSIPAKAVTTSISVNTNTLREVESLVGHYQFNVAAGSNVNAKGDRGYSHVESMKVFEKNHSSKLLGNSSGGYLDGSYNEGGSIYKAYLMIETSTVDLSLPDYPITFVAGSTNNKMETKVEYYCFDTTYSSGNERRSGYIDVTDFVKQNGYGWYYVCNIPYSTDGVDYNSDQFAGWKLIVIEENYDVPMRMLKLKLGSQNVMGKGETSSIEIQGDGIRTSRTTDVTGQFLFGMAGADPSGDVQSNSIKYACVEKNSNSYKQEITESDYNTFTTKSNVRTVTNPLNFINSRNGVPLESESVFENPVYFKDGTFSSVNENGSYQTGAGDLELLDINSTSDYYHDVKLSRNKNLISFKFETVADCALMTTVLGIAVDIDVPSFDNDCDITYDGEENQFTVSGTLTNTTDLYDVGVLSPIFTFVYDSNMTVTSYDARVTSLMEDDSAKYERTLSRSDIKVDKDTHSISFDISGTDDGKGSSGINTKTDTLYYTITLVPNSIEEYYDNEQYISGTLYSSGTDTGLYLDKIAAKTFRNTLEGVVTKKSLSGKIIWDDDNDKNGYRPEKVEVSLCMDSVAINTQDITGKGNIWEYSFDDLSKYKTFGYEYDYTSEIKKEYDHYTISYDGNDITLTLEEKYVPDNNVITDSLKCGETIISDMSLSKIGLSDLNEAYGITSNFTDAFTDKVREE